MRNKIIAAAVAGALLVGAGLITSAVSVAGTANAQEDTTSGADGPKPGLFGRAFGFLEGVLEDLVGDGTITQDDADAVLQGVEDKAEEMRAEHERIHELLDDLLSDGVLTKEEAAQLPADHPLLSDRYDEAWEDGQLTTDEIREFGFHPRRNAFERGLRLGSLLDDGGIDQSEYDSIPDDHPIKQVDVSEYLADGLITPSELREIMAGIIGPPKSATDA